MSNLQVTALRFLQAQKGQLSLQDFATLDQRTASGLGKRRYVARIANDQFRLTKEGEAALRDWDTVDIFRQVASLNVAKVFERPMRLQILRRPPKKAAAA